MFASAATEASRATIRWAVGESAAGGTTAEGVGSLDGGVADGAAGLDLDDAGPPGAEAGGAATGAQATTIAMASSESETRSRRRRVGSIVITLTIRPKPCRG